MLSFTVAKTAGQFNYMFPRTIDASLIEDGDTIKVSLPKDKGLDITHTGTVHHRTSSGRNRYLFTEEGAIILSWSVDKHTAVLLIHRPDYEEEPLFGEAFAKRIAS